MSDCHGRWTCKECKNMNYPWYEVCVVCKEPRPQCDKVKEVQK
jgi:hypothetical protein